MCGLELVEEIIVQERGFPYNESGLVIRGFNISPIFHITYASSLAFFLAATRLALASLTAA